MKITFRLLKCVTPFFLLFFSVCIWSQTFERMETVSGFEIVQENNGVAVADYDGDLDLDIFIVAKAKDVNGIEKTHSRLFRNNNNGTFTDVTQQSGLVNLFPESESADTFFGLDGFKFGAFWGDYDNDGFPDIFFTYSFKVQLFRNQGDGTFEDVTQSSGISQVNNCRNTGATWFDFNNDSFLDIYISDWDECDSNTLYRNNGNGTFTNVTQQTNIVATTNLASYVAVPIDVNSDGFMDLYVSNDFNKPNSLFLNQSGTTFTDQSANFGLNSMLDDMGITVGDFNNDGHFDFFITGIDENALLVNDGNNNFIEQSASNNILGTGWAWGTRFADFDLDGDEDLFIANGYDFEDRDVENNVYYKNLYVEGGNGFTDASSSSNLGDTTISVEAVDFDYDNDGDLDIFVTNSDRASYFYENKTLNFDVPSDLSWFKVSLQGTISNRDAIGTKLKVTTTNGQYIRNYSGVGFLSQSLQPVHFGLSTINQIDELEIIWPSGLVETYQNLDTNIIIKAIEGQGYQILDIQPSIKIYGCTDPNSCSYNPEATLNDGSCTYLPSNFIVGSSNSGFFKTETYTYPLSDNATANWQILGGELLDGQGTDTITVKWGLEQLGQITVTETNSECSSLQTSIQVSLSVSELPDDKSIARLWNEMTLEAIRGDFARPTIHARNLFHTSIAMYDAWAIYDDKAKPYLIGNEVHNFTSTLVDFIPIESIEASRKKAISYAMYRLINYRFQNAPKINEIREKLDFLMTQLGYETSFTTSTNYQFGNAAALGNYIAKTIIDYGNVDGSRELQGFSNAYYQTVNLPLSPNISGNTMVDPNRWQPLSFNTFIDQAGNIIPGTTPNFLSPEWGNVAPFALTDDVSTSFDRDGNTYKVYHDPSSPPYLSTTSNNTISDAFKWTFNLVSTWASHLDPSDGVMWDISPNSIGNIDFENLPTSYLDYPDFYDLIEGGDISFGHSINPITGNPYETQVVPRGDYTRVLAEFWADGPDSETPPGHWFTILNYVNDQPLLEKRLQGTGDILDALEWDVKSYFILGGAMHDAAISAWSVKGWYDYVRPISAIRYMSEQGQSTNPELPNYNIAGIPLREGYVEVVQEDDPLAGNMNQHIGKIKLYTWRGHDFISNTDTDVAGVGWILAENWWPYQRPTFVTPPFAGYVSGHSTFSRAAAVALSELTGSDYFPGGYAEFVAKKNEFLVFEQGPSVDVKLQWATYRDASDQCSLSRIWGGIHPPADDIPGRFIGEKVGKNAFDFAIPYFNSNTINPEIREVIIYPNPVTSKTINITNTELTDTFNLFDIQGRLIPIENKRYDSLNKLTTLKFPESTATGIYVFKVNSKSKMMIFKD